MSVGARRAALLAALLVAACYGAGAAEPGAGAGAPRPARAAGDAGTPASPGDAPAAAGLPCAVDAVLARRCRGCHGPAPRSAPMPLVTRDDLLAPAPSDGGRTVLDVAVARMRDRAAPMPPAGPPPSDEVAELEAWRAAGAPEGVCGGVVDGGAPAAEPPSPTVCTSGTFWTRGDRGAAVMHPGGACLACHARRGDDDAPRFQAAGTLYPTSHEPADCNGEGTSAYAVVLTGADGRETRLSPNAAGNFFTREPLAFPIRARVEGPDGAVRAMGRTVPSGDCNGCHTERGTNGAPGRVRTP